MRHLSIVVACAALAVSLWDVTAEAQGPYPHPAWVLLEKETDETVSSDATLSPDARFSLDLDANTKYRIRCAITYTTNSTADFKWRWDVTGTSTLARVHKRHVIHGATSFSGLANQNLTDQGTEYQLDGASGTAGFIDAQFDIHKTNSGTWSISWAQLTSTATDTTVHAGSYCEYMTVPRLCLAC